MAKLYLVRIPVHTSLTPSSVIHPARGGKRRRLDGLFKDFSIFSVLVSNAITYCGRFLNTQLAEIIAFVQSQIRASLIALNINVYFQQFSKDMQGNLGR